MADQEEPNLAIAEPMADQEEPISALKEPALHPQEPIYLHQLLTFIIFYTPGTPVPPLFKKKAKVLSSLNTPGSFCAIL